MSAYLVIEATVRDRALDRYASQAIPMIRQFRGEVIVLAPSELLFGERRAAPHRRFHALAGGAGWLVRIDRDELDVIVLVDLGRSRSPPMTTA
jgi:hypothetical protein